MVLEAMALIPRTAANIKILQIHRKKGGLSTAFFLILFVSEQFIASYGLYTQFTDMIGYMKCVGKHPSKIINSLYKCNYLASFALFLVVCLRVGWEMVPVM